MECPCCGSDTIAGEDHCRECGYDLTAPAVTPASSDAVAATLGQPLSDVGLREPIVLSPQDTVAEAVDRMRSERWGSVLVMEGESLRGIFSEQDLLRRLTSDASLENTRLLEVMTPDPDAYSLDAPVSQALNGMALRGNRHLPVMDEGERVRGTIGVRMVLSHIQRAADL